MTVIVVGEAGIGRNATGGAAAGDWAQVLDTSAEDYSTLYCVANNGLVWCVGSYGYILRSTDDGLTWTPILVDVIPAWSDILKITYSNGVWCATTLNWDTDTTTIIRSTDNGLTWAVAASGLPEMLGYYYCLSSDGAGVWLFTFFDRVYRSIDNGATWALVKDFGGDSGAFALAEAVFISGDTWIASGTKRGVFNYDTGLIAKTTDNGSNWTEVASFFEAPSTFGSIARDATGVTCAAAIGYDPGYIYRSPDGETDWAAVDGPYSYQLFNDLCPGATGVWWAAIDQTGGAVAWEIYRSADNGLTWANINLDWLTLAYGISDNEYSEATTIKLLSLKPTRDRGEFVTRVYPRANGISLADTTRTASGDYTLAAAAGYIVNTAAETLYGRRERVVSFTLDLPSGSGTDDEAKVLAANALYDKALEWLGQHDNIPTTHTARVTGQAAVIQSLTTIRIVTTTVVDGETVHTLDADFNITRARNYFNKAGKLEAELELSTIERGATTDAQVMAEAVANASRQVSGANSTVGSTVVSRIEGTADINSGTIDGTIIGQEDPENGTFEDLVVQGDITLVGLLNGLDVTMFDPILETAGKVFITDGYGGGSYQAVDAADVSYTPTTLTDWDSSADPGELQHAVDQLAARIKVLEGA